MTITAGFDIVKLDDGRIRAVYKDEDHRIEIASDPEHVTKAQVIVGGLSRAESKALASEAINLFARNGEDD